MSTLALRDVFFQVDRDNVCFQTVYVDERACYRRFICDYLRLAKIYGNTEMEVWLNEYTTANVKVQCLRPSSRYYVEILKYKMPGCTGSMSHVGVHKKQHTCICSVGRRKSK